VDYALENVIVTEAGGGLMSQMSSLSEGLVHLNRSNSNCNEGIRVIADARKMWLLVAAAIYIVVLPICAGTPESSLPVALVVILYSAYSIWLAAWFASLFWVLRTLGRLYEQTKMEMWGWFSVPYSIAIPGLVLVLGLDWRAVQRVGLFFILAYLAVASSILWALATILLMLRKRTPRASTKLMLGMIPLGALVWVVVLNRNLVIRLW
jgi:hypothetical protein